MSDNYKATVIKIDNLRKHSNADRLQCTNIFGNNVIVGLDVKEGDLGLFFPLESALSKEFIYENSLSAVNDLNKLPTAKGYFGKQGRVKALMLRGEKSMGFYIPINSLQYIYKGFDLRLQELKPGTEFYILEGHEICSKYTPNISKSAIAHTKKANKRLGKMSKLVPDQFRFHYDTAQLGKNLHKISPNDIISITWKMHGTSAIASNLLTKVKMNWFEKIAFKLLKLEQSTKYDYLYASRRVVKNDDLNTDYKHYYKYDLWTEVGKEKFGGKLQAGESIYYEIVGYTKDGSAIQGKWDYGCKPGEYKVYVYRITRTAPDGSFIDLDWGQLKERCNELAVDYTPEIYYGKADDYNTQFQIDPTEEDLNRWRQKLLSDLQSIYVYDQDSQFCVNKVPEEGIVVRKEGLYLEAFKLKSFRFLKQESDDLDKEIVDIETAQSEILDELTEQAQELNMGYDQKV